MNTATETLFSQAPDIPASLWRCRTLWRLLRGMQIGHATVHGFRSAFRDWAAECTDFPSEVCEAASAHSVANKVEAAYRRTVFFEKRRSLMARWAEYLDRVAVKVSKDAGPTASEPMPFRAAA